MNDVKIGQVYASNHNQDKAGGFRQHRTVTSVGDQFVFLKTKGQKTATRVRLRTTKNGRTIPGHRLVVEYDGYREPEDNQWQVEGDAGESADD